MKIVVSIYFASASSYPSSDAQMRTINHYKKNPF